MMVWYLLLYFAIATAAAVWVLGTIHAYEVRRFPLLNNKPAYFEALWAYFFIFPAVFAAVSVYRGYGWVWPKRGVTYDRNEVYNA